MHRFGNIGGGPKVCRHVHVRDEDVTSGILESHPGHEDFNRWWHRHKIALRVADEILVAVQRVKAVPVIEQLGDALV